MLKILFVLAAVVLLIYSAKKIKMRYILLSACTGMLAVIAADLVMSLYGAVLELNLFSLSVGALGGVPGVILLTLMKTIFPV